MQLQYPSKTDNIAVSRLEKVIVSTAQSGAQFEEHLTFKHLGLNKRIIHVI